MIITYIIVCAAAVAAAGLIIYYFYRYVFSIKQQLANQRKQIHLLLIIAQKLGATISESELEYI